MKRGISIITGVLALLLLSVSIAGAQDVTAVAYKVGVDDVLDINILQPEALAATVTVAPDGSVNFPYIGNVMVRGSSLENIQKEVQSRLADGYMKYPVVSVALKETRSKKFFVYGEVVKPGTYFLEDGTTILKAISMSGGLTKFGSTSRVKILRPKNGSGYENVRVNIAAVMSGDSRSDTVIMPGDIVVVSEGIF